MNRQNLTSRDGTSTFSLALIAMASCIVVLGYWPGSTKASQTGSVPAQRTARQSSAKPNGRQSTRGTGSRRQQQTPAELGAVSKSELALPLIPSWRYLTDSALAFSATVDSTKVYLPLARGRVICLNRTDGSLLWGTDLGGRMTAPPVLLPKGLYVATARVAPDGTESGGLLRILDTTTGLTLWQHEYSRPFTSPVAVSDGRLYAGSADGALYALKLDDGEILWKCQTSDVVEGEPAVTAQGIFFGSDDGALRGVDPRTGREIWKYQTQGKIIGRPSVDGGRIYFGSGDACVYCVTLDDKKLKWRYKTGAAVVAPPLVLKDKLFIGSYDNFFYALSRTSGDKIWKRRFEDRITSPPIVSGDALMVAPYRGDHVAVFLIADGRRVNYYHLDEDFETVATPVYSNGFLFIPTDHGLVVAATAKP